MSVALATVAPMHLLYVTEFEVLPSEPESGTNPLLRLLEHAARWLGRGLDGAISADSLTRDGTATLSVAVDGTPRVAQWSTVATDSARAVLIEVSQNVAQAVQLTTRVTIGDLDGTVSIRVGISRESSQGGALTPIGFTSVFQPGIIGAIARDRELRLETGHQGVSDRYLQLPSASFVDGFAEILDSPKRLPVLLVNTSTQAAWDFAREAARRLIGLVRVVTLANYTRWRLASLRPHIEVPPGGARLVWSDSHVPGPTWSEERILSTSTDELRGAVMRVVAPLSALYRGSDAVWREARRRAQRVEADRLAERVAEAQSAADQSELIAALQNQVNGLIEERNDFERLANEYAVDADSLRDRAERVDTAEADAKYWRDLYFQTQSATQETDVDPWTVIVPLVSGVDPSETFRSIEAATEGRVVFTPAAASSWSKINYPEPEDMHDKLLALANAAVDLYGGDPGNIGRIDDWFKQRHGLNISTADDTIQKNKSLRWFEFDGRSYDQTPHVKVRDAVKPNQVGRVHFAMDSDNKRFVINHVALKLYGI